MAGFEVVVRPAILPGIRPARQPRVPTPTISDDQNLVVMSGGGSGAKWVDLTTSTSYSMSKSRHVERKRVVDVERVYQKDDAGNINKGNFVDVERVKKIVAQDGPGETTFVYSRPPQRENVDILEKNKIVPAVDETGVGSG